jgi:hypothetical protein
MKNLIIVLLMLLTAIGMANAIITYAISDVSYRNVYSIYNASNIYAGHFYYTNGTELLPGGSGSADGNNYTSSLGSSNNSTHVTISLVRIDGTNLTTTFPGTVGPQGPTGATGPQGPAGTNGTNGIDGVNGSQGPTGPQGPAGTNGTNGINGINGTNGINGINGTNGIDGVNGTNAYNITINTTNNITSNDGTGGWTNTTVATSTDLDVNITSGNLFVNTSTGDLYIESYSFDGYTGVSSADDVVFSNSRKSNIAWYFQGSNIFLNSLTYAYMPTMVWTSVSTLGQVGSNIEFSLASQNASYGVKGTIDQLVDIFYVNNGSGTPLFVVGRDGNVDVLGNVTASTFIGDIDCSNITGGTDTDYCTDAEGAPGTTDGNNYTTSTAFTGTMTKTLTTQRSGMPDLTASFVTNYSDVNNTPNLALYLLLTDQRFNDTVWGYITSSNITAGQGIVLTGLQISHNDSSSVSNSDNSGRTYIQDISFDALGHVISVATATETITDTNNYTINISNNGTSIHTLTLCRNDGICYSTAFADVDTDTYNTTEQMRQALYINLTAQDACSEISGCVVGAITDGNTGWDNSYSLITLAQALSGLGNWSLDKSSYITLALEQADNSSIWNKLNNIQADNTTQASLIAVLTSSNTSQASDITLLRADNTTQSGQINLLTGNLGVTNTTANAALPKAGGTMTANITIGAIPIIVFNSTNYISFNGTCWIIRAESTYDYTCK